MRVTDELAVEKMNSIQRAFHICTSQFRFQTVYIWIVLGSI